MKNGWQTVWLVVGVVVAIALAGILSIPIWKINQFASLRKEQRSLQKERESILNDLAVLKWKVNVLSARARLEQLAQDRFSLGYNHMPILVEDFHGP